MRRKIFLVIFIFIFLTGCSIKFSSQKNENGGFFASYNKGDDWQASSLVLKSDGNSNFQSQNVNFLVMDPTDNQALYLGTDTGLFYSYDYGKSWQQTLGGIGSLRAIAIDPDNRCTIYASINNRLYKTVDCSRHWSYKLIEESTADMSITSISARENSDIIYAGTVKGGLFTSSNSGESWRNLKYFDSSIEKIMISSDNSTMYLATSKNGIFRSDNNAEDWINVNDNIQQAINDGAIDSACNINEFQELIFDPQNNQRLLFANHCLLESNDKGQTWKQIKLLTRPQDTTIYSLAVSYSNPDEIFYGTDLTFYKSSDNGINWTTKELPTTRAATTLLTDPVNPTLLYLGVNNFK